LGDEPGLSSGITIGPLGPLQDEVCLEERLDLDWEEIPEEIQLKSEKDT